MTNIGLLCAAPMPDLRNNTQPYASVIRALESVLALTLGLMYPGAKTTYGRKHCAWSIDALEYDGLCCSIALEEGIHGEVLPVSPAALHATFESELDPTNLLSGTLALASAHSGSKKRSRSVYEADSNTYSSETDKEVSASSSLSAAAHSTAQMSPTIGLHALPQQEQSGKATPFCNTCNRKLASFEVLSRHQVWHEEMDAYGRPLTPAERRLRAWQP